MNNVIDTPHMNVTAIACIDIDWGIGIDGKNGLPWPILKHDLEHFWNIVDAHKYIIVGRKTWDNIPKRDPIKNNKQILVVSRTQQGRDRIGTSAITFTTAEHVLTKIQNQSTLVIGGGEIYRFFINVCDKVFLTRINKGFATNIFFPRQQLETLFFQKEVIVSYDNYKITEWQRVGTDL